MMRRVALVGRLVTRRTVGVLALTTLACAPAPQSVKTMPNPAGCFVQLWDGPRFTGGSQFVNGPRSYPTLKALVSGEDWARRIRSAQAGPAATVTAWTDENLSGNSFVLQADGEYPALPPGFDRTIESISISCAFTGPP